jgi:hypothetical protein
MPPKFNHSRYLNTTLMMIICGPTNCGKTHLLFQMLTTPGILDYNNLIIYTTTPEQNYYQFLKHGFYNGLNKTELNYLFNKFNDIEIEDISEVINDFSIENQTSTRSNKIKVTLCETTPIDPSAINKKDKNIIIFDDCVNEKDQSIQKSYFTRGRHNSCSCIYLTQSFYGLDCQSIRRNTNVFIIFHLNKRNLIQLMQDVDVGDESEFKDLCKSQFKNPREHKYILINIEAPIENRLITYI